MQHFNKESNFFCSKLELYFRLNHFTQNEPLARVDLFEFKKENN